MARFINSNNIITFQKNVTTSGTPVQLTDSIVPEGVSVVIRAKKGNTGDITVGGSSAQALNTGTSFFRLQPEQSISYQVSNTNFIWIDATVSGEGVEVTSEY
jgi:hypothetical protein